VEPNLDDDYYASLTPADCPLIAVAPALDVSPHPITDEPVEVFVHRDTLSRLVNQYFSGAAFSVSALVNLPTRGLQLGATPASPQGSGIKVTVYLCQDPTDNKAWNFIPAIQQNGRSRRPPQCKGQRNPFAVTGRRYITVTQSTRGLHIDHPILDVVMDCLNMYFQDEGSVIIG
jgi:hypothetical protein